MHWNPLGQGKVKEPDAQVIPDSPHLGTREGYLGINSALNSPSDTNEQVRLRLFSPKEQTDRK
jgi:hypothetical protein